MLKDLIAAMESGSSTIKALKLKTRAGMGICQGRTCRPLLEQLVSYHTNQAINKCESLSYSHPVRPPTLEALAKAGKEHECENN